MYDKWSSKKNWTRSSKKAGRIHPTVSSAWIKYIYTGVITNCNLYVVQSFPPIMLPKSPAHQDGRYYKIPVKWLYMCNQGQIKNLIHNILYCLLCKNYRFLNRKISGLMCLLVCFLFLFFWGGLFPTVWSGLKKHDLQSAVFALATEKIKRTEYG